MGKKLTDEDRARRIVGEVHVRELAGRGKCKICKQTVPVCEMAVKAIPLGDGYWRPDNAAHCVHCAEIRRIGTADEDGHMKRLADPWARRVDEGFTMLWEFGNFGEAPRF